MKDYNTAGVDYIISDPTFRKLYLQLTAVMPQLERKMLDNLLNACYIKGAQDELTDKITSHDTQTTTA